MRDVRTIVSNQIAIAEYRFEARGDGFVVYVRRQLGWASLFTFVGLLVFVGFGVWFGGSFVMAAWRGWHDSGGVGRAATTTVAGARRGKGPPVCCLPFVLAFVGLWLSVPLRGLLAHWRASMGREEWRFGARCITPATSVLEEQGPLSLAGDVRAGLILLGTASAVGISSGGREVVIGPFRTVELARGFEAELRRRRPEWFGEAGSAATDAFGLSEAKAEGKVERVVSWEVLPVAGGFDVVLTRARSPQRRRGTAFMIFWLCGWVVGEVLVSSVLARSFLGLPAVGVRAGKEPPRVFLSVWLIFWTFAGFAAVTRLVLHLSARERWRFREGRVTAGRSWAFPSRRTLVDEGRTVGRLVRGTAGWEVEMVSAGVSLSLGPVAEEAEARALLAEVRRRRAWWGWTTV